MHRILFIGFLFCLSGCGEEEHSLGSGYYIIGSGPNTAVVKKDSRYTYDGVILGQIVKYSFDKDFIVVFRNASKEAEVFFGSDDSLWIGQRGIDSLQYWIVEKEGNNVFGPLSKPEYSGKMRELSVPEKLRIKD